MKKPSKREQQAAARRAADPVSQIVGRSDIDYEHDDLPAAPRSSGYAQSAPVPANFEVLVNDPRDITGPTFLAVKREPRFIKFRAQASVVKVVDGESVGRRGGFVFGHYFVTHDRPNRSESWIAQADGLRLLVYPDSLGQFTGLCDKNGKEIFEGDRVRLAGYGDYVAEFPFIQLYEASAENNIGEILGHIYEDTQ